RFHGSEEGVASRMSQLDSGDGYRALVDLKARGEIEAIGAGINLVGMIPRFLERFPVDFFLVAMPYTLLDQQGLDELQVCAENGISVVIGAPYASGILARGPGPDATYRYAPAKPDVIAKVERVTAVCRRHDVPLAAAALQFPLGHPAVVSVIPGPITPEEVRQNLAWLEPRYTRHTLGRPQERRTDRLRCTNQTVIAPQRLSEAAQARDRAKDIANIAALEAFFSRFRDTYCAEPLTTSVSEA